jgi:hypothetical protein
VKEGHGNPIVAMLTKSNNRNGVSGVRNFYDEWTEECRKKSAPKDKDEHMT